jgi:hypothetical protein
MKSWVEMNMFAQGGVESRKVTSKQKQCASKIRFGASRIGQNCPEGNSPQDQHRDPQTGSNSQLPRTHFFLAIDTFSYSKGRRIYLR